MKNKSTKTSDNSEANRPAPVKIEDDSLDPELHRPVPFKIRDDMLALELRRRAEEINREKSALAGGNQAPTSLSPAEIYEQFHEIQVHQIELELQNEELRRIQLELNASQARYFDIYELAPVGYIILSYQDMIIEANLTASKLLGISRSWLAAYTFVIFILNADRHIYHQNWKRLVETGLSQSCELRLLRRGGSQFWAQVDMSAGLDADGKFAPRVVITDISERKLSEEALLNARAELEQRVLERTADLQAANAALEKASRAKDDFLAIMSHELRTPLTGILGLAQVMQYKTYGEINEKQMTAVQNIEKNGLHLLELINEILDFSRIQSGNLVLQPSKFTLESACSACIHMVESLAEKKHQELSFNISPYGIMVNADERRLRQVIINLLSNAIKFTPDGGRIQLIATGNPEQQQVCICVKDNGIGIHDEDLPRLFQPFQQLDMRLSRMYNGAGLGLSLVKNLTELHGGSVKVESEFGQGSTFSVILPWDPESGEA